MSRRPVIGLVGPDNESANLPLATKMGTLVAEAGWVLLTGGRSRGVMDAACKGAKAAGGTTVGILPTADASEMSEAVDIPIVTGMGSARDNINALSCDVMVAAGMGPGTAAEVALALKAGRHVLLLACSQEAQAFFASLRPPLVHPVKTPEDALATLRDLLKQAGKQ